MSDFKAKMHQNRFRLGLRPMQTPLSLQRSPRPPNWIYGTFMTSLIDNFIHRKQTIEHNRNQIKLHNN